MNFDFIRYKARVLQTTSFNVLLFSVDISIQSQMQIKTFKAGSKPFVVVWASNFDIEAVARALTAKHIATEIVGQSAIDIIAVALTALHLATTMNEVSEIEVMGRVCGAVAVTVENIEALITILVAMKTQASMTASVDFSDTVDIVATLRACGYTEVEVQLTASMLASLTVRQDAPIDIATDSTNSLDIEVDVQSDSPIEIATHSENNLDLTVIVSPDGAVAILAPGEYELTAVADVALDDSKAIIADAESAGIVSITVNLLTLALLTDYDADTLSSLDTLSLEALDYIEIN